MIEDAEDAITPEVFAPPKWSKMLKYTYYRGIRLHMDKLVHKSIPFGPKR